MLDFLKGASSILSIPALFIARGLREKAGAANMFINPPPSGMELEKPSSYMNVLHEILSSGYIAELFLAQPCNAKSYLHNFFCKVTEISCIF